MGSEMGSEMTPELEAKLASWLAGRAPATTPPEFVERVLAIPRTTPIDRRRGLRVIDGGRRRMLLLVAATVTSLGIVGGGLILAGMQDRDTERPIVLSTPVTAPSASAPPPASASPSSTSVDGTASDPVIPAEVGSDIAHGAVDTPLGRARWVHWQRDATTFPDPLPQLMPDGRYAWYFDGRSGSECAPDSPELRCTDPSPHLWVSDGLLAPREPVALPSAEPGAMLLWVDDRFWFLPTDPAGIWWSTDLRGWQTADTDAIRSPGIDIPWNVSFQVPTVIAGTPAVWARFTAADPGALLGHPGESVGLSRDDAGRLVVRLNRRMSEGGPRELGFVSVKADDRGIRFLDDRGRVVGRVDGVGMEFVEAWLRRSEIVEQQLFLLQDGRWQPVVLPLGRNAAPGIIDARPDGAIALAPDVGGRVHLLRSTDGRTWTDDGPQVGDDGSPLVSDDLWIDDSDGTKTYIVNRDGSTRWASTDGETWMFGPFSDGGPSGMRVSGGWVKTPDQSEDGVWQVSRDGITWQPVPELSSVTTKITPNGAGGSSESVVGDAIWFTVDEAEAPYTQDVWVVEFDRPAS